MLLFRRLITPALVATLAVPAAAHHLRLTADLSGAAESPVNNSSGAGHVVVTLDLDLVTMEIDAEFSGLLGTVTAAHIHGPTSTAGSGVADVATQVPSFADFPLGANAGAYSHEFDLANPATYNPAFIASSGGDVASALNSLITALEDGKAYFNVHTTAFSGGEIRGFLSHVEGDYNLNGMVDAADYVVWRHTLGEIGDGLVADASENSTIDADDFNIWRENFGNAGLSVVAGGGTLGTTAIPEPTAVWMLAAYGIVFSTKRIRLVPIHRMRRNTASSGRWSEATGSSSTRASKTRQPSAGRYIT